MNRRTALKGLLAGVGVVPVVPSAPRPRPSPPADPPVRDRQQFDDGWRFFLGDPSGASAPNFDDSAWRPLNVPHDWSIEGVFSADNPSGQYGGYAPAGIGWYRKTFAAPAFEEQTVLLEFDGVYQDSQVWINGSPVGGRSYGFIGFIKDLTPYLNPAGNNVLAVRVDNSRQPNCRWYTGSGILRHVWLTITGRMRVAPWGTAVTTPTVASDSAAVRVVTSVVADLSFAAACHIQTDILDPSGNVVATAQADVTTAPSSSTVFTQDFVVPSPRLWSSDSPALYSAKSSISQNGLLVDQYTTAFGIRSVVFDSDQGLLLNGQSVKLKGVCLHENFACLGGAVPDRTFERQLRTLQSMGCNAIRCCHNPYSPVLLDLCDRMGFLVIAEAFDKWNTGIAPMFELPDFATTWQEDLGAMLQRDRNHPSIILWSVGNEAGLPGTEPHDSTLAMLAGFVHQMEPSRPVTCAIIPQIHGTVDDIVNTTLQAAAKIDVLATNYQEQWFDLYRAANPSLVIVDSESYPYFHGIPNGYDTVNNWYSIAAHPYVSGQFVWVGFDYLGESAGWPSKGWPNGFVDTCGFVKPGSFFHQTVWAKKPLVKLYVVDPPLDVDPGLAPWSWPPSVAHWNFSSARSPVLAVATPANCETVELILNGFSYGQQQVASAPNSTITWYVKYEPGTLQAIGRTGGAVVSQTALVTSGPAAALTLQADQMSLAGDGHDVSHVEISLIDGNGILVPDTDRLITVNLSGPARLIGIDNGELRSAESYRASSRTSLRGRCLAVIQSLAGSGAAVVTVTAANVRPATVNLTVFPPEPLSRFRPEVRHSFVVRP